MRTIKLKIDFGSASWPEVELYYSKESSPAFKIGFGLFHTSDIRRGRLIAHKNQAIVSWPFDLRVIYLKNKIYKISNK